MEEENEEVGEGDAVLELVEEGTDTTVEDGVADVIISRSDQTVGFVKLCNTCSTAIDHHRVPEAFRLSQRTCDD